MSAIAPADEIFAWLGRVATGAPRDEAAVALAAAMARASRAERAFVLFVTGDDVVAAWGADLDGLAIGDADRRAPANVIAAVRGRESVLYEPRVATPGGEGCRLAAELAAGSRRAVVVLEHRFLPGRFDALDETVVRRFALCAALLMRMDAEVPTSTTPRTVVALPPRDEATLQPLRVARRAYPTIVGESAALRDALARLDAAVDGDLPVLIVGETGTGKELFARAVHDHGARANAPFLAVNCAAIADSLFEAELFGHARGSFTGADRARAGLFARAEGGTLFLDEIGELSLVRQASLLRVLETRRYRPVGSDEEKTADVRIVAATNRELPLAVAAGTFRQDLLYRLDVLRVRVPPLREREGDVLVLVRHFLAQSGSRVDFTPRALAKLAGYDFPGNVRELVHLVARLGALGATRLDVGHLPREIRAADERAPRGPADERREVERALADAGGNISHAAVALGVTRHGLKKRMVRLGMRSPGSKSEAS